MIRVLRRVGIAIGSIVAAWLVMSLTAGGCRSSWSCPHRRDDVVGTVAGRIVSRS